MEIDIEMLQNTVMSQVNSTKSILSDCSGLIKGINIPEDFSKSGTIKAAVGKISIIEELLSLLGTSVSKSIADFITAQNRNGKIIDSLSGLISINSLLFNIIDPDRLLTILKQLMETNSDQFTGRDLYGCDPYVYEKDGEYFYIKSTGNGIEIFKSKDMYNLEASEGKEIFSKDGSNIWAPELHYVDGHWYVYAAMLSGEGDDSRRMYVLESNSSDPTGDYTMVGELDTGGWAIDGTLMEQNDKLYYVWSGWPGDTNGKQNLYIAPMDSPKSISGERVCISSPTEDWETKDTDPYVNEGPQILKHNGETYIVYSANGSWGSDYCLGTIKLTGSDPLDSSSWTKSSGPVFSSANGVYGPRTCIFYKIS